MITSCLNHLYRSQCLTYLERRTSAIYHYCDTLLQPLSDVQSQCVREVGVDPAEAILHFPPAPPQTRRDISMFGLVRRAVRQNGPAHFRKCFEVAPTQPRRHTRAASRAHGYQVLDKRPASYCAQARRSALGLVPIYSMLPHDIPSIDDMSQFQKALQELAQIVAAAERPGWADVFSPRTPMHRHPLRMQ